MRNLGVGYNAVGYLKLDPERGDGMDLRVQSIVLMIVGLFVLAFSLLADLIGVGLNQTVIGWKQYSGAVLGVIIMLFGAHIAAHHVLRDE